MNIPILFTCHTCGLQRVRVFVEARREDEDVVAWVKKAGQVAGDRHMAMSPHCRAGKVDLAIPLPAKEGDGIGTSASLLPDNFSEDFLKSRGLN